MRILLALEPGADGVFRHVEGLAGFLRGGGQQVALAYSSRRESDALVALVRGLRAQGCEVVDLAVGSAPEPADAEALWRLRRLVADFQPDVIHAHSSKAGALGRLLPCLGATCPILYTPNAYYGLHSAPGLRTTVFNLAEAVLAPLGCTVHVSRSEDRFAEETLRVRADRSVQIPNGVNTQRFRPPTAGERAATRARWGIPGAAEVIGTVGRYSEQKDPHTLYAAMREVLARRPQVWLLHVGRGELFDEISGLIAAWPERARIVRVEFLANTVEAYHAMDVFALSSRYEGLAISALEAIACGLPLVLTRCPGNVDFDNIGLNAVQWAPPGEAATLSRACRTALDAVGAVDCNHRVVAQARFGEEAVYGRLRDTYRGLARAAVV